MSVYYTAADTVVPSQFMMFPKELFKDKYSELSLDAKVLYSVLLDRVGLSIKNQLIDTLGHVYIVFKQTDIMALFNCAKQKAQKLFKELEVNNLIERKKQGCNLPDLIYVMNIEENCEQVVDNTVDNSVEAVDNFFASEWTDENHSYRGMKITRPGGMKISPVIYTNTNNTELNNTKPSIYQEQPKDNEPNPDDERLMDRLTAEQFVESKIDYYTVISNLSDNTDKFVCNTIVSVLTEIYSQKSGQVKINGYMIGYSSLREKFLTLNSLHVEYVLECVRNRAADAGPIRNWRAYLVTALYHAESSMDVYYDNLVKFDRYKAMKTQSPKDCGRDLSFLVV